MPEPIRDLVAGLGLSCRAAAKLIGVPEATLRHYIHQNRRDDPAVALVLWLALTMPDVRARLEDLARTQDGGPKGGSPT